MVNFFHICSGKDKKYIDLNYRKDTYKLNIRGKMFSSANANEA